MAQLAWASCIFTVLLVGLLLDVSSACPVNLTASTLYCTRPVERRYEVIVQEIIQGNDSGVNDLCTSYTSMLHCLHEALSDCGRMGRTAYHEAAQPLMETVGKYCQYYREEHLGYVQSRFNHVDHFYDSSASSAETISSQTVCLLLLVNTLLTTMTELSRRLCVKSIIQGLLWLLWLL